MSKNKIIFLRKIFIVINGIFLSTNISYALRVEPYYDSELESVFEDKEVPATLKVLEDSEKDGIKKGDILYRNSYKDLDYYSPIPPSTVKKDLNNGRHAGWGPWKMDANKVYRGIETTYYYQYGRLTKQSVVETDDGTVGGAQSVGTLPAGTNIEILGIRNKYVYFDMSKHSGLSKLGTTGIGRVSENNIQSTSSRISLVYTGYSDRSKPLISNFKPIGKYQNNMRSFLKGVVPGHYVNPNRTDVPIDIRGKNGEWRYLGYNAKGEPLDNPYFTTDASNFYNISTLAGYPLRYTPWNPNDNDPNGGETIKQQAYDRFLIRGGSYQYDVESKYQAIKREVINRLVREGHITSQSDYINRLSLKTHPAKQPTILLGQMKNAVNYRVGILPLESGLRDIYIKKMTIYEQESNKKVAQWSCDINGGCPATRGTVKKNGLYSVEIILSNGANSYMIKDTLESQFGFIYNASNVYNDLPFFKTFNRKTMRNGNKGSMYSTINSDSAPFRENFYVSTTGTIDIYGYVGSSHNGVDNLKYHNDLGVIRLSVVEDIINEDDDNTCEITNNGTKKICGKGDMYPYGVKIFSKTENGKWVYYKTINGISPDVPITGLIPGYEYRLVYNMLYDGDEILEYTWIPSVQDNPNTPNINEYREGYWGNAKRLTYKVPIKYTVEKYSGGIRETDILNSSGYGFLVASYDQFDVKDIPIYDNVMVGYYVDIFMFQHPYVKTTVSIDSNAINSRINTNRNNDTFTITHADNFDISVSNLKVTPSTTFVSGNERINYNVTYNANLLTPSYVGLEQYETVVDTAININGQTYYVKDHLLKGTTYNNQMTHTIENVSVPSSGIVSVNVNMNYNKTSYESSNFSNNIATEIVVLKKVKNPSTGNISDKVGTADTLNSNNASKGGDANNNCLVPRLRNTWTTTHSRVQWNSTAINYNKISNNAPVTFRKYTTSYKNTSEATVTYEEQFGIKNIYFRSKYTKDKKYGNDGWVDLLNSTQKDLAIIQAGYGFELKVVTNYSTDAFTKKTWNVWNDGVSGTRVSNMNTKANYGMEDIFVELPGTDSTRKILSSTGYEGTILGLNSSKTLSGNTVTWTYTVKPKVTVGIKEAPKIFIPENMKDGDYTLKIYTPPVPGVGSINKKTYSAMCDRKEVVIKVRGSAMNDLNSHNTQI